MNELPAEFLGRMADLTSQHIEGIAIMGDTPFSCPIISQIDGNLWTGGCPAPEVPSYFKFVLNLYPWMPYDIPEGTEVKAVALYDDSGLPSVQKLEDLADWVNEKRKLGPTLCHCQAGLNRSALVAGLALIRDGRTPAQAIELLRSKRSPAVLCNPTFERFLRSR
jgi:protein-tyrosine phosphatase